MASNNNNKPQANKTTTTVLRSVSVLLLGATAFYLLYGGPAREVLAAAVARTGKTVSFVGTMTSTVAAAAEDILEHKQVKTLPEKMETLKEYMQDYFLYSCMIDELYSLRTMAGDGKAIIDDVEQLRDLLRSSAAAKAMAMLSDPTTIFGNVKDLYLKIKSLVSQIKEMYEGKQTELVKQLLVLKTKVEGVAQGKFLTRCCEKPRCYKCGKILSDIDTHELFLDAVQTAMPLITRGVRFCTSEYLK